MRISDDIRKKTLKVVALSGLSINTALILLQASSYHRLMRKILNLYISSVSEHSVFDNALL